MHRDVIIKCRHIQVCFLCWCRCNVSKPKMLNQCLCYPELLHSSCIFLNELLSYRIWTLYFLLNRIVIVLQHAISWRDIRWNKADSSSFPKRHWYHMIKCHPLSNTKPSYSLLNLAWTSHRQPSNVRPTWNKRWQCAAERRPEERSVWSARVED